MKFLERHRADDAAVVLILKEQIWFGARIVADGVVMMFVAGTPKNIC